MDLALFWNVRVMKLEDHYQECYGVTYDCVIVQRSWKTTLSTELLNETPCQKLCLDPTKNLRISHKFQYIFPLQTYNREKS